MAKTFGWKYTEQYSGVRFQRRHDYVESFQGGYKLQEHCGECGAMDHVEEKMDGRKKFSGKQAKKDNEDRRAAQRKKLGILGPNEETINEADYELYHKTFSAAMQHAYAHAKKRGYIVDPDEIDNKVATGPKKPSSGKTNKYILGTNKKQKLHVHPMKSHI